MLEPDACYRALRARDPRFDGAFFVGVTTTGIYCRSICPARTPGRERCRFFSEAAGAEREGFRACFRCRPELAPGVARTDVMPRLVSAAASQIERGYLNEHSVDDLAADLDVTARHLRRVFEASLGVSPLDFATTRRLGLAKQLLQDTELPMAEVAFASGFSSVRRFNGAFLTRFGRAPSAFPRTTKVDAAATGLTLRLDFRPPFHWDAMLAYLGARAIPGVESVVDGVYRRAVVLDDCRGEISLWRDPKRPCLRARIPLSLAPKLMDVAARLRALTDLDAPSHTIDGEFRRDPRLGPLVKRTPGLRVPGAFDGFELAVRAVLGQQVSVAAATTLAGRMAARFGTVLPGVTEGTVTAGILTTFPSAAVLAKAPLAKVRAVGLPETRAHTVIHLARAVASGNVDFDFAQSPEAFMAQLTAVPGIGPWTAQYLAMRVHRFPDAFPAGDLVVRRALGVSTSPAAEAASAPWQPFRAYAVMHLWRTSATAQAKDRAARKRNARP